MNKYTEYAEKVLSEEIVAGKLVKLACERYLSWFSREDMEFRPDKVDRVVNFIHLLRFWEGPFKGQHFTLQDWQFHFICAVYGFYWKGTNRRVIRNAYLQISRKCGKTTLASALSLYALIADNEDGAEVYMVAPSRAQSAIAYRMATNYVETINKAGSFKCLRNVIEYKKRKSLLRTFSPEAKLGDGYNPSFALVDEYHAFNSNEVLNVLRNGTGARLNPLVCIITTAGRDLYAPCYEYRQMCEKLLNNEIEDDTLYPLIYELDSSSEFTDENCWKKACPSLDITVTKQFLRDAVIFAKNNPSEKTDVLTKNFNMWVDNALEVWIENDILRKHSSAFSINDLVPLTKNPKYLECYVAVDLAATRDLTAVTALVPIDDKLYFKNWCFLPEEAIKNAGKNKRLYEEAIDAGFLIVTPGNTTDYDYVSNLIIEIDKIIPITKIAYDRALCHYWATRFEEQYELPMYQYSQGLYNFTVPTHELERMLYSDTGLVVIDDNPLIRWQFSNVIIKTDYIGNCKPMKDNKASNKKIDNIITMLMAFGAYLLDNNNGSWSAFGYEHSK